MLNIGCHLSSSDGFEAMGKNALAIGANTFAFFTRNPRGGAAKDIDRDDVARFIALYEDNNFAPLVAHSPYTLNPCSSDEHLRKFAAETMADDLKRMEYIPGNYYNFHPGSHTGQGIETGIKETAELLNSVLNEDFHTTVLIETMSGKGSEIGGSFEQIRAIIDAVTLKEKVGVCLDTCHIWDGGYDIVKDLDGVLADFNRIIGIEKLKAVHINDSKNALGSKKDRHEKIGMGQIGFDALLKVTRHPYLSDLPFILETPNEADGYADEIKRLRGDE